MADSSIFADGFKTDPYWWDAAPPDECGTALPDGRRSGASPDPLSDSTVMFLADFAQFALK